jgi:hypothetical protein
VSPLDPPLRSYEYEMMERDTGKYLLYCFAVRQAMLDLKTAAATASVAAAAVATVVRAVVVGPGRGRLVQYILDGAEAAGTEIRVLCLDANPLAVQCLHARFVGDARVVM